ncbi:MAG: DegT/DnrJ/EryC1/StrS aminotransferase [Microgenomates group bacterium Gr01-1014_16]|nr:MAG: DegT/DnrJ/EryC1/StrS aminotransferase [Microgenomates group bacterium Gr01-1014_16]
MAKKDYELGGELIRTWSTYVPEEAITEVSKTLRSGWLNTGKKEKELRATACKKWGFPYCVAVNNGTAALRASLATLGVGPGDEVISTPFTFIATNTAILEQGAKPVFADIKYDDLNIDPKSIEKKITSKTKAIIVVHYGGNPCDMAEIWKIGRKHRIPIIEDAAHAFGSMYKGNYIGAKGDLACFSFQVVKIINSGDGGLISTSKKRYYKKLKKIIWYGIDKEEKTTNLLNPFPKNFRGEVLGFKYNMNDIVATLALAGVNHFDEAEDKRKFIGERYRNELGDLKGLKLMKYYSDRKPNYQIFPVHVENRLSFAKSLHQKGIMLNINNRRNDIYPMFGGIRRDLVNTAKADKDVILLPMHSDLTESQVSYIIENVAKFDRLH